MQTLPAAFAAMAAYRQFLCYALVPSQTKPGKFDKLPVSPHSGQVVTAHDPRHWTTAEHACRVATAWGEGYGVAFVFTVDDPFFFIDIDGAFDGLAWSPLAQQIVARFPGAAVEVSQSGAGLHIFGTGKAPAHGKKNASLGLEFYTELRFVALTGLGAKGDAATDHTPALHALTAEFFPPNASADGDFSLSTEPVPEWRGPTDDADLIRRALMSKSAAGVFGGRASFADLWEANVDALGAAYPDAGGRPYDASQADAALVSHLAFWTGRHGERIERLMRQSALLREKWEREDYLPRTIAEILARPGEVLQDKPVEAPAVAQASEAAPAPSAVIGQTFLTPDAQRELFAGCVYVQDRHRVLVPGGALLKPEQFRVAYGGYCFAMDAVNERTTRNAWEAFTESQVIRAPRADTICFRPDLEPGAVVKEAGIARANTWWPAEVKRTQGSLAPFLTHLAKILPDHRDQIILLSYMAACVQHKGVKFQWCPVLQGVEGNGKTLFSACIAEAVGQHYTHWPKAKDLLSDFNGWLPNKLFVALEELKGADQMHTDDILETLKTLITGGMGIQIQFKGVDQSSMAICANFLATTNYKNAVRKNPDNARRFAMFYTAQQTKAEKLRDGMTGDYFRNLWAWLRRDGFAIVADLLHTYPIADEFNPALGGDAPDTSTTHQVIVESRGSVEQHIAELIAQDTPGFMGGWISSVILDRLLTDTLRIGSRMPHSKRREMLQGMGYILHPGLPDGRVNNPVLPDGRRAQLFIQSGHPSAALVGAAEIARAYTTAQMVTVGG